MPAAAAAALVPATAPARAPGVWMVSPAFDLTFFVGTALVTLLPWLAVEHLGVKVFLVMAAVGVLSNGPHLMSTWTRVYLDGNEVWRRPVHYFVVPAALAGFVSLMIFKLEGLASPTLLTVLFYWAFWHFLAQNWGILRIYQRRCGDARSGIAHLERVVLYLGALWPLSHRLFTGPWTLFGAHIRHPTLEPWMVNGLGAALAATALLYLGIRVVQAARGARVPWIRPLMLLASWFGFMVPFMLIKKNGTAAFAAAACWHGLQYLGIVWFYNRNRWKDGVDPRARFVSWISQPGRPHFYFLGLLALAGAVYLSVNVASAIVYDAATWGSVVWISLTFGHYYLDGVIWKLRKPELQRRLVQA
jgi:hypothetical protein